MGLVAPARWRLAAFGVNALNGGDFCERSVASVTDNVQQQPRDVGGRRSVSRAAALAVTSLPSVSFQEGPVP
jgi:hypothetical protein